MDFKASIEKIVYSHRNHPEPERQYLIGRDVEILLSRPAKRGRPPRALYKDMMLLTTIELIRNNRAIANLQPGETVEARAALICEGGSGPNITKIVQRRITGLKARLQAS